MAKKKSHAEVKHKQKIAKTDSVTSQTYNLHPVKGKFFAQFRYPQCIKTDVCNIIKGQSISEWIYEVIVSPKIQTKKYYDFCPHYTGQKSCQFLGHILGETMIS